jgi:uncharacterized peroxidase-related enzyme
MESMFEPHTPETAPAESKRALESAREKLGFVPHLFGVFAEAPAVLRAYQALGEAFESTSLNATERQVVLLTTSFENGCEYCMAVHSTLAREQKVPGEVVEALREGRPIPDHRLRALSTFVKKVVHQRGTVGEADVEKLIRADYTPAQVLEVLVGISMKTLSNYANHIAHTPLDQAFEGQRWSPPEQSAAR